MSKKKIVVDVFKIISNLIVKCYLLCLKRWNYFIVGVAAKKIQSVGIKKNITTKDLYFSKTIISRYEIFT